MGRRKKVEGAVLDLTGDQPVLVVTSEPVVEKKEDIMSKDDMVAMIIAMKKSCDRCGADVYSALRKWGTSRICRGCYAEVFPPHCAALNQWMTKVGLVECAFCKKPRVNPSEFHFDHINMFKKEDTVCRMLFDGEDLDAIKAEIQKCQLLCICCHAMVTKFERKLGFIQLKNRRCKRRTGVKKEDYMPIMSGIYSLIKELRGGGGSYGDLSGSPCGGPDLG